MRIVVMIAMLITACLPARPSGTAAAPESARARAALASIVVENRTEQPLRLFYRLTSLPVTETLIGRVLPDSVVTTAPVPAGEPIVLIARTDAGRELVTEPYTMAIAGTGAWRIDRSSVFVDRSTVR